MGRDKRRACRSNPPQMSFQIKKRGVVTTLFYLRCRESLAISTTRSDSIFASISCNSAVVAPRAIASSRAEAMRINSSPSLIFSRNDSISAAVNISPEDRVGLSGFALGCVELGQTQTGFAQTTRAAVRSFARARRVAEECRDAQKMAGDAGVSSLEGLDSCSCSPK